MIVRKFPLAVKLWSVFAALTLVIFALLAVFLPWLLRGFFTDQIYGMLLDSQSNMRLQTLDAAHAAGAAPSAALGVQAEIRVSASSSASGLTIEPAESAESAEPAESPESAEPAEPAEPQPIVIDIVPSGQPSDGAILKLEDRLVIFERRSGSSSQSDGPVIHHFVLDPAAAHDPIASAIGRNAAAQEAPVGTYTMNVDDKSLFYAVRKEPVDGQTKYIVSYVWGSYRNDLVAAMYGRLLLLMIGIIVASWPPCWLLARYMTRPLVEMERHVGRLADRDWHEPLRTNRSDEIGRLARAIEAMRQRLVRQDEAQQFYLQNVSHELKTPVMVIRSYAQSILDGIFPKGDLHGSAAVILQESERLERLVRDLLLLNKLNYFAARDRDSERSDPARPVSVETVARETIERLRCRRRDIAWSVDVHPDATLAGDEEHWRIAFENVLDNQLRYARSKIAVEAVPTPDGASRVRIANDGPPLDGDAAERLFEPFRSGAGGQFGLGLAIARQIAAMHDMDVRAANEPGEVAFYFEPAEAARRRAG
ncbi:HAMP domain-containing sensor histidine kinase [Paenibacillus sp.]|uniref:sensor histidine kinase n=1 Tax=Paenibacillus sp. TaxID=58172 RepID=UPI002D4D42D7|nr:HAMP domain-containing sensor histidine kinase [Paenibacillus sp.]HZG86673.1 HAMP domain-containing sensor histidine kinase [Paenibacillus sp.]